MSEPRIPGGYILLSRKVIESEIWEKPPLYIKIWIYLLTRAQHADYKGMNRGQLRTSIPEIMEGCSWYVGYRKVKPTKDQVFQVIDWLRKSYEHPDESNNDPTMITTTKATQGLLINICNYSFYQDPKNYESNKETTDENSTKATREQQRSDNINKNDKNVKNEQEKSTIRSKLKFETHHIQLAELLFKKIQENNPSVKQPNLETWANTLRLMMERDNRTGKDIQDLIIWSQQHHFWHKNILSADKLRKQFDRLFLDMKGDEKPFKNNVVKIPNYESGESNAGSNEQDSNGFGHVKLYK
ncbi:Replication protein O [Virgibacillus sp. CBA3643]|uniref:Replication protein O n=1 Tax=Virgibacillus sp. CBA3643 TaxID=2942278 RepID=UPI0035A26540